jgi:hypothetical protein
VQREFQGKEEKRLGHFRSLHKVVMDGFNKTACYIYYPHLPHPLVATDWTFSKQCTEGGKTNNNREPINMEEVGLFSRNF